jgi:hypothetical protein
LVKVLTLCKVRLRDEVADCAGEPESTTVTPKEKLPPNVGVPEMTPVSDARLSPAGRLPEVTDQV